MDPVGVSSVLAHPRHLAPRDSIALQHLLVVAVSPLISSFGCDIFGEKNCGFVNLQRAIFAKKTGHGGCPSNKTNIYGYPSTQEKENNGLKYL